MIYKHAVLPAHFAEGAARQMRFVLSNPAPTEKLGEQGRERVPENFLIIGNVKQFFTLFLISA
jgi:hypothetical protein